MDKAVGHQPTFSPPRALAELIERSAAKNDAVMGSNRFSYRLLDRLAWAFAPFDADRATLETLTDTSNAELARFAEAVINDCLLYTSPSPRDMWTSRMPSSA